MEWIADPPIWNAADPVGAVMRTIGWSSSGFTVCLKSETCLFVWDVQHDFCLPPLGHLEKFCILFGFLHVLLHLCNSCIMLYCTLLYGINLCSSCIHVCNSPENSYPAFLLLLHTTYKMYPLYFWCCHDSLHLWYLLFLVGHSAMCRNLGHLLFYHPVQYLEQPSPMQTVVYCFPNLAGPHQKLHSLHWIFFLLMYDILLTHVWVMISCICWYYVILMIPWVIEQKLWMVIFFWFCMDFVPSCM